MREPLITGRQRIGFPRFSFIHVTTKKQPLAGIRAANNETMKRIHLNLRAWFVSLAALLAALPACADVTIDQLEFTEVEGGYSVKAKSGATLEGALVIPEMYGGEPVVEIGDSAFFYCQSLTSVTIPDAVTTIGGFAFYDCSGLTSVHFGDAVTTIGNDAFRNCSGLTSIYIGDGVTTIEDYAFYWCSNLTSVHIGDGVMTIGNNAFEGCSGLTSITIPETVTTIGDGAFENSDELEQITCYATTPPRIFDSFYEDTTLYVPEDAVEAYRQHEKWGEIQNIIGIVPAKNVK